MENTTILTLVIKTLTDYKAHDITHLDVQQLTPITDHMVICTGTSRRHVQALASHLIATAKDDQIRVLSTEGLTEGEWVLIDLTDVVVHVMQAETRQFYSLEKLWSPQLAQAQA